MLLVYSIYNKCKLPFQITITPVKQINEIKFEVIPLIFTSTLSFRRVTME